MNSTAPVPTYDVKRHYDELRELERNSLRSAMPFMVSDAPKAYVKFCLFKADTKKLPLC